MIFQILFGVKIILIELNHPPKEGPERDSTHCPEQTSPDRLSESFV